MNSETENGNTEEACLQDTKEERAQVSEVTWASSCRGKRIESSADGGSKVEDLSLKGCRLVDGIPGQQGFLYLHGGRFLAGNPLRTSKPSDR